MSGSLSLFATLALLPAMTGPVPGSSATGGALVLALCGGGSLTVPVEQVPVAPGTGACCAKGCRSSRRKPGEPEE